MLGGYNQPEQVVHLPRNRIGRHAPRISPTRGPWPPEKTIFRLEKDSLVLCWSIFGETIPKTFESNAGENIGLYEFRRVVD